MTCGPPPSARSAVIGRAAQQDDPPYEDEEPLPEDDIDEYFDDLPGELDQLEDGEGAEDDAGIDLGARRAHIQSLRSAAQPRRTRRPASATL